MSTLTRVLTALVALIGAVLSYAVVAGKLPEELARRSLGQAAELRSEHGHGHGHEHGQEHAGAGACCEADVGVAAKGAEPAVAQPAATAPALRRFAICPREEASVRSSVLQLSDDGPPLVAVGCGSSLQLLGFERFGAVIEPRRLLELRLSPRSQAESPHAIDAFAADVDGDGRRDLVASALLVDAAGAPRGGGVFFSSQRVEGSFEPARRLLELAPIDVAPAVLDAGKGQDLLLLNGGDARLARPSALWLVTGGPSPLRAAVREAGVGSRAIAACDLDGDGLDELIEGGGQDGLLRLWPSGVAAGGTARTLAAAGVRELVCVRDGPRERAVAVAGDQLGLLRARDGAEPELVPLEGGAGLRNLHTLDLDGDGAPELIGYAHPELVAFSRRGDRLERRTVAVLSGQASVLEARLVQLGGERAPELLVLTIDDGMIAASVLADVAPSGTVGLPADTVPTPSGPLLQRIALR